MSLAFPLIFFDVDSTLVTIEGIEVLGGDDPRIVEMTRDAMDGRIPIDEVYGARLEVIRPDRAAVEALAARYLEALLPDAKETIAELQHRGAEVHLLTAAIEQAVGPLAESLGIPARHLHAVRLEFAEDGSYRDFDRRSLLTRKRGKEIVIRDIRSRTKGRAALVGDGSTDAEARGAVDRFIGFGGVARREAVREAADIYVEEPRLAAVLPHLLEARS